MLLVLTISLLVDVVRSFYYWQASQSGSSKEHASGIAAAAGSAETLFKLWSETVDFSVVVAANARK